MNKLLRVLADEGSVLPVCAADDCGITSAFVTILTRPVSVLCVSESIKAGVEKTMLQLLEKAEQTGVPVLLLFSAEEKLENAVDLAKVQKALVRLSGVCPVLSIVEKEAGELAIALLSFSDFCIFASGSHTGSADVIQALDLPDAIENLRTLLSFLPLNCAENPPRTAAKGGQPQARKRVQTAQDMLNEIVDPATVFTLYADTHTKLSFACINGRSVGVISAEQTSLPSHAARFIQFCDCYSLPVILIAESALTLQPQIVFMLAQATIPIICIGNEMFIASLADVHIAADAENMRAEIVNALEYLSVKRDVLPLHKHGNLPL